MTFYNSDPLDEARYYAVKGFKPPKEKWRKFTMWLSIILFIVVILYASHFVAYGFGKRAGIEQQDKKCFAEKLQLNKFYGRGK